MLYTPLSFKLDAGITGAMFALSTILTVVIGFTIGAGISVVKMGCDVEFPKCGDMLSILFIGAGVADSVLLNEETQRLKLLLHVEILIERVWVCSCQMFLTAENIPSFILSSFSNCFRDNDFKPNDEVSRVGPSAVNVPS